MGKWHDNELYFLSKTSFDGAAPAFFKPYLPDKTESAIKSAVPRAKLKFPRYCNPPPGYVTPTMKVPPTTPANPMEPTFNEQPNSLGLAYPPVEPSDKCMSCHSAVM